MHRLAGDYELVQSSAHHVVVVPESGWTPETPIIPSKVVEVGTDGRFILAKRQHLKHGNGGYEEPVEGEFDFWILDTRAPAVYGPFDSEECGNKRRELGVSDQLQLQGVGSLSPYRE
ncbi:MAG: DUF3997 domain-containing protein [Planctomycetia bacterium]|nr:DUF3997 domain-containing protein [Planctomycetia bacterium]